MHIAPLADAAEAARNCLGRQFPFQSPVHRLVAVPVLVAFWTLGVGQVVTLVVEEVLHPPQVGLAGPWRHVVPLRLLKLLQVTDGPPQVALGVRLAIGKAFQDRGRVDLRVARCQHDVPLAPLGNAQSMQGHRLFGHDVLLGLKVRPGRPDDVRDVVPHRRDVLDQHELRPQHLGSACHPRVQGVLGIVATGVVVEVAVSLTRWATDEEVQLADVIAGSLLERGETRPKNTVEIVVDGRRLDVRLLEIVGVDVRCRFLEVDSEANVGSDAQPGGCLGGAKG
jgi:hypothetical protein